MNRSNELITDVLISLGSELSMIEEKIREVETPIIDDLANEGCKRISLDGFTVSTKRNLRGSAGGNMPGLIRALKGADLDKLVSETVNAQRLTSWINEFDEHNSMSPVEVRAEIEASIMSSLAYSAEITTTEDSGTKCEFRYSGEEFKKKAKIAVTAIKITETFTLGMVKS